MQHRSNTSIQNVTASVNGAFVNQRHYLPVLDHLRQAVLLIEFLSLPYRDNV